MARVLNKNAAILELKAGNEVIGGPILGYSMRGGQYHGWTVRTDTLMKWLKQGLVIREPDDISSYYHFRWCG